MSQCTFKATEKNVDIVSATLCNLVPHMSIALLNRLVRELQAGQITTQTKTDMMTAFQRAYDETKMTPAESADFLQRSEQVLSSLAKLDVSSQ
jgi:hypothetical protein